MDLLSDSLIYKCSTEKAWIEKMMVFDIISNLMYLIIIKAYGKTE